MPIRPSDGPVPAEKRRRLRARAHRLKPVVIVGSSGVTSGVTAALEQALEDHALIKIRVKADDRVRRREIIDELCTACRAHPIQIIGHVAVLFREPKDESLRAALSEILN
ncbi:MAG TPA: ribosome assembly RNA-binding protein YhbY [Gammaproteobacteria bacterium]|nr:ribosome assembly RNA-binding protein YhbY [Gammaproteobacteria bacterium]